MASPLTPVQATHREQMRGHGLVNAKAAIRAAETVGLPLAAACALIEKESGGANLYGHDSGGYFAGHGKVTEANFTEFYQAVVVNHHTSNGVGPCQITYPGYFPIMKSRDLKAWLPYDNMRFGFGLLLANYRNTHSWMAAGGLFNGGGAWRNVPAAYAYGIDLSHKVTIWSKILAG